MKTKITLVVLGVAMIAGAIGTVWMVDQSDHEKRSDLISQARLVAHSFHDDPIKYLSGTESDLDSPNYQHIKQILISTRSVNTQYRFIYLMGRKSDNKTIFFFADSEPSDSPDFSPPGQTYAEASDVIQSIFDKKNAAVEGPVSDQWGTWFSAYAPLIGPVSGEVIAVIGIDIAAGDWYWDIASQSALPVGLLLGFLLVFSYILLYRLNKTVDDQQTKLLESEKRFRTMFQENRAIMLLIEPESGKILDANDAAIQFYGFTIEKLTSMSMDEINTMDPAQTSIARASVLNKEKNHFYFQHKLASGEIRDIESYTTPIITGGEIVLFSILHDITDRKRIEQRYRELVEQIPEVIYTDEIGGDWQFISPNIEALCGYTAEELIADADLWMNNIPTEDQIRIQAEIRSLSIGDILGIDFRFQTRDRGMIWIRDHGVVKEDRATGKKLIQGLLADITEQKKVEEALQKLYENLGRSQSIAHVGNWSLNLSNNSFGASEEGFRLLGFPPEANTTFDEVTALIHNNDRQRVREVMMKAIQIGSPYQVEMRIAKKDTGEFRHLLSIGEIEQDAEGRSIQVFGINQDITERKQIEEELAGEKQRLANIIRGTDIGTWAWNIQTNEEVVNERYAEILGYTLEELAPISADIWEKYAHPDDFKKTEALLEKHFNGVLDSYENEVRMRHKSGRWVWVLDKGKVITWTEDGKPWMMFGTHQDITERKQMEEALRENETRLRAI
ncbi:MAG: PAS domain S-box protein, partial [Chloroflexota bacterium]